MYLFKVYNSHGDLCETIEQDMCDASAKVTDSRARKFGRDLLAGNKAWGIVAVEVFFVPLTYLGKGAFGRDYSNLVPVLYRGVPYVVGERVGLRAIEDRFAKLQRTLSENA